MLQNRFWQGFFALAPFIALFIAFIGYFLFFFTMISHLPELENSSEPPMAFFGSFGIMMILVLIAILCSFGSLIFYIVHAVQNPNLKENNLMLVWILLFLFANGIGQLIYWFIEIIGKRDKVLETVEA